MTTNHYFNNFSVGVINEQKLLEDLIVESIRIMGHDIYYIPRDSYNGDDEIYGETINAKFTRAYCVEMYIANVEGYEGDGDFFSKFGLEIRDTSNFIVSRRAFEKYIPYNVAERPREGDLIYVPLMRKLFELKFVEEELNFFSIGKRNPYMYELRCELFRFSDENFETGVDQIDDVTAQASYTIELSLGDGTGTFYRDEVVYQGNNVSTSNTRAIVTDYDASTKKLTLHQIVGTFATSTAIKGVSSNSNYIVVSTDTLGDHVFYDDYDNKELQDEGLLFIDLSEINPFGVP